MPGVISLLDPVVTKRIEDLKEEMTTRFGVGRGCPGGIPHVTFHLSERDVEPGAIEVVEQVAKRTAPFTLYSSGLGTFPGLGGPVLYITVARAPAAAALAHRLEEMLSAAGFGPSNPYYSAERWIPHITIAQQNLEGVDVGALLAWLAGQPLAFELPIQALSVAKENSTGAEILATFPLSG